MNKMKENWFRVTIVLILVALGLFVSWILYQSMVAIPEQKITSEQKLFEFKVRELDECDKKAEELFHIRWNNDCAMLEKEPDCALPLNLGQKWEGIAREEKDRCVVLYKN